MLLCCSDVPQSQHSDTVTTTHTDLHPQLPHPFSEEARGTHPIGSHGRNCIHILQMIGPRKLHTSCHIHEKCHLEAFLTQDPPASNSCLHTAPARAFCYRDRHNHGSLSILRACPRAAVAMQTGCVVVVVALPADPVTLLPVALQLRNSCKHWWMRTPG